MHVIALRALLATILLVSWLDPDSAPIPKSDGVDPPSFNMISPNHAYDRSGSITEVDFRNFVLQVFDERGEIVFSPRLVNGRHFSKTKVHEAYIHDDVQLRSIHYIGDLEPPRHAVVTFYWISVGASLSCHAYVQVFEAAEDALKLAQQIGYNCKAHAGTSYDDSSMTLTVKATHYTKADAHCCPSKLDIVSFKWAGAEFKQESITSVALGNKKPPTEKKR